MDDVAPDGSPVEVYLSLPVEPDLRRVRAVIPAGASVLDLGSGPGRLANPLAAAGHAVVAVDDSAAMLAHVVGAETVLGDVWQLDLGRRFGAVLALSNLINDRDPSRRAALLSVCRRHLNDDGVVIIERYAPGWVPVLSRGSIGNVGIRLDDVQSFDDGFSAAVTYDIGDRSWTQRFTAAIVGDEELGALAMSSDLTIRGALGDGDGDGSWVVLVARTT